MMEKFGENIWTYSQPLFFLGLNLGCRMTVVQLSDGGLWVHSPVPITDAIIQQLNKMGEVKYVVAPNTFHHLHLQSFKQHFSKAKYYGCQGLDKKKKEFTFDSLIGRQIPEEWKSDLELFFFQGKKPFNELVFFHPRSQTLIITDLMFNMPLGKNILEKFSQKVFLTRQELGPSRMAKYFIGKSPATQSFLETILQKNFSNIILSHGNLVRGDAKEKFKKAFDWVSNFSQF